MPARTRKPTIAPTLKVTDAELDTRLAESVPSAFDPGYEGHMLRVAGTPWREIAEKIGAPGPEQAQRIVSTYLSKAARAQSTGQMQEALQTQVDRYEAILRSWWGPATTERDEKAALVVLRAMERLDRVLRLTDGDVTVTKETLVVSADPSEYVKQLQEVVESRTPKRS
jgi:hypothetical protein